MKRSKHGEGEQPNKSESVRGKRNRRESWGYRGKGGEKGNG